jgi:hypothetical protein
MAVYKYGNLIKRLTNNDYSCENGLKTISILETESPVV